MLFPAPAGPCGTDRAAHTTRSRTGKTDTPRTWIRHGTEALAFLTDEWSRLYQQDPHATPYQSPQWLTGWVGRPPQSGTPLVVGVDGRTGPLAAIGLHREDNGARSQVRPLSAPFAEDVRPVGPAAGDPAVSAALWAELKTLADHRTHVQLTDIPVESSLGQCIAHDPTWSHTHTRYATVPLPMDFAAMSSSTRREHRRRLRDWHRLADDGHHIAYHRTTTTADLKHAYRTLAALRHSRWGAPADTAEDTWPLLGDVLHQCTAAGAFVATLTIDTVPVAAQLCLYRDQDCYSLATGMDPHHRRIAPGHVLLLHLVEDLVEGGFTTLHLGRTVDTPGQIAYKAQYGTRWTQTLTTTSPCLPREPWRRT